MSERQSGHIPSKGRMPREQVDGPVPQRHRLRQGEGDGVSNPFGADAPSTERKIANNQGKTY